ncbi:MAG TPA: alpha/beta hydrolase-fold protein [Candidatus Dormibacteraeota bacterium]|jgi:enterochelin esterase-like enzyme|nr:alpha/beta hydrolase-fold protein [Candidatus Dormibacteraeota bacterium]
MPRIPKIKNKGSTVSAVIRATGATGDLRLHEFRSRIFRNTRFLRVWLPPGYDDAENHDRRYPVLYLNDGQNLFESSAAFAGVEWQVDETADRLIREGAVPPMIIVGIDNTGRERLGEYMPHRSMHPMMLRERGRHYPDFLMKEVMPFVGQTYRIASGPENTGLGGSSLGALIALYTATARPGVIGRLLLESPSLWASGRQSIKESRIVRDWPERIFLAVGTAETGSAERSRTVVDDVRELAAILRRAVLSEKRLRLVIKEGAGHNEAAWADRFPEALQFLFGP